MFNIKTVGSPSITYFRKLAIGTWKAPNDSTYYGKVELDLTKINELLEHLNKNNSNKITINHVIAKTMGIIFNTYPELNITLIRNKPKFRKTISAFFQTHLRSKKGYDLLGINIEKVHQKSLQEIANEVQVKAKQLRDKKDIQMEFAKTTITLFPLRLMHIAVKLFNFLMYTLNLNLNILGLPNDRYGSFGISSIGGLGMEEAYIPLFPFSRCGMMIAVGKPALKPIVINKEIKIAETVIVTYTFDHRYYDGAHLSKPFRLLQKITNNPTAYLK